MDETNPKQNVPSPRSQRNIHVSADGGNIQYANTTVSINTTRGMVPTVNVSEGSLSQAYDNSLNLDIEAPNANISIAEKTNVMINVRDDNNGNEQRPYNIQRADDSTKTSSFLRGQAMQHDDNANFPLEPNIPMKPKTKKSNMKDSSDLPETLQLSAISTFNIPNVRNTDQNRNVSTHNLAAEYSPPRNNSLVKKGNENLESTALVDTDAQPFNTNIQVSKELLSHSSDSKMQDSSLSGTTTIENFSTVLEKEESEKLHFQVREGNQIIQIGKCCLFVDIVVNKEVIEMLKKGDNLQAQINSGETLISLQWGDTINNDSFMSELKLMIDENNNDLKSTLETEMLQYLVQDQYDKVCNIVNRLAERNKSRLRKISSGCIQLTLQHFTLESFKAIHTLPVIKELEIYFNAALISSRMREISTECKITIGMLTSIDNPVLYSESPDVRNSLLSSTATSEGVSSLESFVRKSSDDIQNQIREIKEDNSRKMTSMQEEIKNFMRDVRLQVRETQNFSQSYRDEVKEEVSKLSKDVRGITTEMSALKENQEKSVRDIQIHQEEFGHRQKHYLDERTELLAERLSQILLPRLLVSLSGSPSIPREMTSSQQSDPVQSSLDQQDPIHLRSLDRHEMMSSELRSAISSSTRSPPSTVPTSCPHVPMEQNVYMDCIRKTEYFLEKLLNEGKTKHTEDLYLAQSDMGDDEALKRALAASTEQTSKNVAEFKVEKEKLL